MVEALYYFILSKLKGNYHTVGGHGMAYLLLAICRVGSIGLKIYLVSNAPSFELLWNILFSGTCHLGKFLKCVDVNMKIV